MKSQFSRDEREEIILKTLEDIDFALTLNKYGLILQEIVSDHRILKQLRDDPVFFCILLLGFKPTSYQAELLRCDSKRILLRWARQCGKTWILAARTIWYCSFHPRTLTLIVAPGLRQSMILSDKIHDLLSRIPKQVRKALIAKQLRTVIRFRNESQIVALPNSENLLRGYTAHQIIADEAAFFRNDEEIFLNVLTPMLATTDGTLIVSSTPWGKNTLFYQFNQDPDFHKIVVTWKDAYREGIYNEEFVKKIKKIRETYPEKFRMEYEAEFIEEVDTWLPQDLLAKICSPELEFLKFDDYAEGDFYVGMDLAERVDYNVVAVVERRDNSLQLVHMKRFPLGTSLATVIGYIKVLCGRWNRVLKVYVDNTKHGDYIIEDMREAGIHCAEGVTFTVDRKMEMAQVMRQRMREDRFQMPFNRNILDELNVEKYELTKSGKITFSHPSGTHDDRFWALALAVYAATEEPPRQPPLAVSW